MSLRSHRSRHNLVAGAGAGLMGGLILGWAMQVQGVLATEPGWILHLLLSIVLGAGFGAIFRYQPYSYATTISGGILYGLLWWVLGPLTVFPLLLGQQPSWSLGDASAAFPSLVGYLFYGGVTGVSFYILVAFSRQLYPTSEPVVAATAPTTRIVILGGGFGGVSAARRLEHLLRHEPDVAITLVSQSNYLLFTPMLAEVAASGVEAQHISTPVRAALPRTHVRRATVEAIDPHAQVVQIRPSPAAPLETVAYDHVIVALGSVPHYHDLPGLEPHAFPLKTLHDATRLRNHVLALLERAEVEPDVVERRRQLTFVVAGGGFAGSEIIAELFDLVQSVLRYYPNVAASDLRFVLVHSRDRILPELSAELADYALQKLQARGIEVRLNTRVARATPTAVLFDDGSQLATYTLVWTAGNQPHPLLKSLPGERDRAGALVVEPTLQAKGWINVWAVGDGATIPDPYHAGRPYPPTAQHAVRAGRAAAENVVAALHGKPLKPFRFRAMGMLVALGRRTAVAEVRGWQFSGLLAWVLWRAVYLSKLPGLEKKLRVALDWTIDLVFPRDIVLTADTATALPSSQSNRNHDHRIANRQATEPVVEEYSA